MVSNFYIEDTLACFEDFDGVFSADNVNKNIFSNKFKRFQFIILNTEELQSKTLGHWISLSRYFKDGKVILELFDSFGYPLNALHNNIKDVIKNARFQVFVTNNRIIQHPKSNYCGFFVIARFISIKLSIEIEQFLNEFSPDTELNDLRVIKYIRENSQ